MERRETFSAEWWAQTHREIGQSLNNATVGMQAFADGMREWLATQGEALQRLTEERAHGFESALAEVEAVKQLSDDDVDALAQQALGVGDGIEQVTPGDR